LTLKKTARRPSASMPAITRSALGRVARRSEVNAEDVETGRRPAPARWRAAEARGRAEHEGPTGETDGEGRVWPCVAAHSSTRPGLIYAARVGPRLIEQLMDLPFEVLPAGTASSGRHRAPASRAPSSIAL
jgi:hypothetical protein